MSEISYRLAHLGVNSNNEAEALATAELFAVLFGWDVKNGNSSVFAGPYMECMKKPFLGKNGHIAVSAPDVDAAKAELEQKGVAFDESTLKCNADGEAVAVYLKEEIAGFAVHLLKEK